MTGPPVAGLRLLTSPVHADERGWFVEGWNADRAAEIGLAGFVPAQHNLSLNVTAGVTRGFHAEPWDKLVAVARGRVFAA